MFTKYLVAAIISLAPFKIMAQQVDFKAVDSFASSVGYYSAPTLAAKLTKPYDTEIKKVRSIFYWIAQHITYDYVKLGLEKATFRYGSEKDSTDKSLHLVATTITDRRGVCSDFSRLFRTLCGYANINAVFVDGYAKRPIDTIGKRDIDKHAWNAVKIDSKWYLLDATWANGEVTACEYYFLTDPEMMKWNHYPNDKQWLLTNDSISLDSFFYLPAIFFDRNNNCVKGFRPHNGIINCKLGSKIIVELDVTDTSKKMWLLPVTTEQWIADTDSYRELKGTVTRSSSTVYCEYVVTSPDVKKLSVYYDYDQVLEYVVNVTK